MNTLYNIGGAHRGASPMLCAHFTLSAGSTLADRAVQRSPPVVTLVYQAKLVSRTRRWRQIPGADRSTVSGSLRPITRPRWS
jgi:hypothetical protein